MNLLTLFMIASQYLNAPYRWGTDGPFEFDCSGLALRSMRNYVSMIGGTLEIPDMTSQQLHDRLVKIGLKSIPPRDGAVLFYGKSISNIIHVNICGPNGMIIEAGGAGRRTEFMTKAALTKYCTEKDARVRYQRLGERKNLVSSIMFKYQSEFDGLTL